MPMDAADVEAIAQALKTLAPPQGQQQGQQQGVQAVALKLPEFWTDKPEVWFARVEAQFNTKGITQDGTKFDYLVSSLDNTTAGEVEAILLQPPAADKYEALKKALLQAFAKTQTQKDAELLSLTGLGDAKPTALLRKLRSLNSDAATLFRAHFLALLPPEARTVLAGQDITDLDELARAADRVVEARRTDAAVAAVSTPRARTLANTTRRQGGPSEDSTGQHVCQYHIKWGAEARSCRPWCLLYSQPRPNQSTSSTARITPASGNSQAGR